MVLCAISLGGNVGDVPSAFAEAVRRLQAAGYADDLKLSGLYRTTPMGAAAGDVFYNAAAVFETICCAPELLEELHQIEQTCGRVRKVHWGPRTLDLDLLLYGDENFVMGRLIVPHPAMWHRRFVLDPLTELIPNTVHPVFQTTVGELRQRLLERPLPVGLAVSANSDRLQNLVNAAHPMVRWVTDDAMKLASIVFAAREVGVHWPQMIHLPADETEAVQLMTDVLTAALDEPVVDSAS